MSREQSDWMLIRSTLRTNDSGYVKVLITQGLIDVDARDPQDGKTLLMSAAIMMQQILWNYWLDQKQILMQQCQMTKM